jgi:hypothetical protein
VNQLIMMNEIGGRSHLRAGLERLWRQADVSLPVNCIHDSGRRQHETKSIGNGDRGPQTHRYTNEILVGSDRKVVWRYADSNADNFAAAHLALKRDRPQMAQEIRNVTRQYKLFGNGVALCAADMLNPARKFASIQRPGWRRGQTTDEAFRTAAGVRLCGGRQRTKRAAPDYRNEDYFRQNCDRKSPGLLASIVA